MLAYFGVQRWRAQNVTLPDSRPGAVPRVDLKITARRGTRREEHNHLVNKKGLHLILRAAVPVKRDTCKIRKCLRMEALLEEVSGSELIFRSVGVVLGDWKQLTQGPGGCFVVEMESVEEAVNRYKASPNVGTFDAIAEAFKAGAAWQKEQE